MTFWRFAVLGDPIDHSLSPAIHGAALAAAGLRGTYTARRVGATGMAVAVDDVRQGRLTGANVTMPHKRLAADLCDEVAADASRAGAVNTLVRSDGKVTGHNTDVAGIRLAWERNGLPTSAVLIIGAGGAAAAALLALEGMAVSISGRNPEATRRLVERVGVDASLLPWGTPVAGAVVVNATPLGMAGEELPSTVLEAADGLFDMAYGALPTPAVATARRRGIPVADGPAMLLGQAGASFRLWTGLDPSESAMRQALGAELERRAAAPA